MKFAVGDIIKFYSPTAGKRKYHLCFYVGDKLSPYQFLFINSNTGYDGDFVLKNKDIPCLPESKTGLSVISCSLVVRITQEKLKMFDAQVVGKMPIAVLSKLKRFVQTVPTLTVQERTEILTSLKAY